MAKPLLLTIIIAVNCTFPSTGSVTSGKVSLWPRSPVVRSLILPGLGEYSLNQERRGRFFILSEATLLFTVLGSYWQHRTGETKFMSYAAEHATIALDGKDRQFWVDIGNYDSRDTYNAEHLRFRDGIIYPLSEDWNWQWDSAKNRNRYENYRIQSDRWALAGQFLIGGMVLNHIISAIDARYLQRVQSEKRLGVVPIVRYGHDSYQLFLVLEF